MKDKKILLVEDDTSISRVYERKLKLEGAEVLVAFNGKEGLDKLKENKVDLILVDLMMPVLNGYNMLVEVRKNPQTKDIPVIVITNFTSGHEKYSKKIKELNIDDYIVKSDISIKDFVQKITAVLNK